MKGWFAPTFSRFLPAWIAFGSSVGGTTFVLSLISWVLGGSAETDDVPPLLIVALSVMAWFAASLLGLVVVPFRRLFVGPRFPFLRPGYAAIAAVPLFILLVPRGSFLQRVGAVGVIEAFVLLSTLLFVGLGWCFGAFDELERSGGRPGREDVLDVFS